MNMVNDIKQVLNVYQNTADHRSQVNSIKSLVEIPKKSYFNNLGKNHAIQEK